MTSITRMMGGFGRPSFFILPGFFIAAILGAAILNGCSNEAPNPPPSDAPKSNQPIIKFSPDPITSQTLLLIQWPDDGTTLSLVQVPPGPFRMGSNNGDDDETPSHTVQLDVFWIGQFEITSRQYSRFLTESLRYLPPPHPLFNPESPLLPFQRTADVFAPKPGEDHFPASGITWFGARTFCKWLAQETNLPIILPTEAQWEKAAHGKQDVHRIFPWGIRLNKDLAQYRDTRPVAVGRFPLGISPFGAYDMTGNVSEWVRDWYDPDYYSHSPDFNPEGPTTGTMHILRGGNWTCQYLTIPQLRSSDRYPVPSDFDGPIAGFRVALQGDVHPQ